MIAALWLHEPVSRRELAAVLMVVCATPLLALTAPAQSTQHAGGVALVVSMTVLGALAVTPLLLRGGARAASVLVPVGAGLAYAWEGLATKFAADGFERHAWLACVVWFVLMGLSSGLGTLGEMSALQRRSVKQVAPIIFALTTFVPVALAPLLAHEWWPASPLRDLGLVVSLLLVGASPIVLLSASPTLGRVLSLAADASNASSDTPRRWRRSSSQRSSASARRGAFSRDASRTDLQARPVN